MTEKFSTPSGVIMHIERTHTRVVVSIDHGGHHTTEKKTKLIKFVAKHALRRYVGASKSRRRTASFNVGLGYWSVTGPREDEEALVAALYDYDSGLYATAEAYLKLASDPHEERAA